MITRCACCMGKKTIMGLGAMIKECPECKGVGHVKVEEAKATDVIDESIDEVEHGIIVFSDKQFTAETKCISPKITPIKQRGRPKRG